MYIVIEEFENYSINKDGVIRNNKTNRILKTRVNDRGYVDVGLSNNGKSKTFLVHRLVAMVFIENYSNNLQVNHMDGDRQNNSVSNLECITQNENLRHSSERRRVSGNISKLKILKLYKDNKFESIDDFMREIMKY